jgi:hypothetical protein
LTPFISGKGVLEELLKASPGAAAQLGEEFSIIQKVKPEDLGYAGADVAVRDGIKQV